MKPASLQLINATPTKLFPAMLLMAAFAFAPPAMRAAMQAQQPTRAQALAFEQANRTADAAQAWTALHAAAPRDPEPLAHLGLIEARQAHYPEAIALYKQAIALNPDYPGLQTNLGLAAFKSGNFPEAIHAFRREAERHPGGNPRLTVLLGMAHYGMNDFLVAIPYLQQAAAQDPQSLPLRLTLAHSCLRARQYPCVMDTYKEILALNAESAEADMLAGEALDEEGDDAGAMNQFRAAIRANPAEPNAHFGLGYLLWKQSHFAEAAAEFQAELANDPTHAQAQLYLADAYIGANDYTNAEPALTKAEASDPTSAMVHRDLGTLYANTGRGTEGIAEFERAVTLEPRDSTAHYRLARLLQASGRRDEAKAEFALTSGMMKEAAEPLAQKLAASNPTP